MTRRPDLLAKLDPTRTTPQHRPGAVYLLPHYNLTRFKVGWSLHPLQRIRQLPEFHSRELDLAAAQVAWFAQAQRAHQVERALHRSLAPFSVQPDYDGDGSTEWFSVQAIVLARRMLSLLPAADGARRHAQLQALDDASDAPVQHDSFGLLFEEPGVLDTWYRVEDLWLRLGALLPLALQTDREQRCLHWHGLRQLVEPSTFVLRSRAVDIETYRWREGGQSRSLVTLMDWAHDDPLLHLMPTRQLQRWNEGDAVDHLLKGYLARHAAPWQGSEGRRQGPPQNATTASRSRPVPTG